MKKAVILVAVLTSLAGCNTIDGFGQDISAGAQAVDNAF